MLCFQNKTYTAYQAIGKQPAVSVCSNGKWLCWFSLFEWKVLPGIELHMDLSAKCSEGGTQKDMFAELIKNPFKVRFSTVSGTPLCLL